MEARAHGIEVVDRHDVGNAPGAKEPPDGEREEHEVMDMGPSDAKEREHLIHRAHGLLVLVAEALRRIAERKAIEEGLLEIAVEDFRYLERGILGVRKDGARGGDGSDEITNAV